MGKTYWFECSKCGYRAKVSGGADRGATFFVQTIFCRDCNDLLDAVTRVKVPDESQLQLQSRPFSWRRRQPFPFPANSDIPPSFQSALNRLSPTAVSRFNATRLNLHPPPPPSHSR